MITLNKSKIRFGPLFTALVVVSLLGALDHTIIASSLATVVGELGGLEQMGWMIVAYTLAVTLAMPVFGQLSDQYGRRGLFLGALGVFLVGSVLCGFAQDMLQLTGARVLQGLGGAGIQLLSQTILADVIPPRDRAKYQGVMGAVFPVSILVGPLAGGLITDTVGWRWIFWMNIPLGLIAFALAVWAIPHSTGAKARGHFDALGLTLLTIGTTGLVLIATRGGTVFPWSSITMMLIIASTVVAWAAFIALELRAEHPLVPLRIFNNRTVVYGTIVGTVVGVGLFSVVSYLPGYVQMVYRTSATVAGLIPLATVFGMLVTSLITGFLVSRSGRYRIFPIVGTAASALGLFAMSTIGEGTPLWVPAIIMAVVGLGTGAFMQLVVVIVQNATEQSIVGAVTSTVSLVRQVGSTVATAVVGGVFAAGIIARLPAGLDPATLTPSVLQAADVATQVQISNAYIAAMSPIFIGLGVVYAVGFVAALLIPDVELKKHFEPDPESTILAV